MAWKSFKEKKNFKAVVIPIVFGTTVLSFSAVSFAGKQILLKAKTIQTHHSQAISQVKLKNTQGLEQNSATSGTSLYLVQFKSAPTEIQKKRLAAIAPIKAYIPEDAFVVEANLQSLQAVLSKQNDIQAIVPFEVSYKLAPEMSASSIFNANEVTELIVRLWTVEDRKSVLQDLKNVSHRLIADAGKDLRLLIQRKDLVRLASMNGVEHIQEDPQFRLMDFVMDQDLADEASAQAAGDYSDINGSESGTQVMNFKKAYELGFKGEGQIASAADTGLDNGSAATIHPDFSGKIKAGQAVGLFGKTWADPMGHGTHVSGSIVGNGTVSGGKIAGGAPMATIVAQSMWSPVLNNLSVPSKLGEMFAKAYNEGARVHSNSWGAARNFGAYDNFSVQVDEWSFNNPDMLILFAAGNSGTDKNKDGRIDSNSMASPGTSKNVLTVGASKNKTTTGGIQVPVGKLRSAKDEWPADPIFSSGISDTETGIAMFSSRGPTTDGRIKPEIVAPGTNILSTKSREKGSSDLWGAYNTEYAWSGGTSMSTPLTAAAATLVRESLIKTYKVVSPSAALMKAVLMHSATEMFPGQFGEIGANRGQEILTLRPNSDEGFGRVNVAQAVTMPELQAMVDEKVGVKTGDVKKYQVTVGQGGQLLVNLVWTDAPGSADAAKALVNNLDLTITGTNSFSWSSSDSINNFEFFEKSGLTPGFYMIEVKGTQVPMGKNGAQPFALVISSK